MKVYIGIVKIPERMWLKNGTIYITPFMCWLCKVFRCNVRILNNFKPRYFYSSSHTRKISFSENQDINTWK